MAEMYAISDRLSITDKNTRFGRTAVPAKITLSNSEPNMSIISEISLFDKG